MNKRPVEIAFLLDRSGSMAPMTARPIKGILRKEDDPRRRTP